MLKVKFLKSCKRLKKKKNKKDLKDVIAFSENLKSIKIFKLRVAMEFRKKLLKVAKFHFF